MNRQTHQAIMIVLGIVAIALIALGPQLGIGIGYGLIFLLCPLMMLGMMFLMGSNHKSNKQ